MFELSPHVRRPGRTRFLAPVLLARGRYFVLRSEDVEGVDKGERGGEEVKAGGGMDTEGHGGIWRDAEGHGGIWRDTEVHRGTRREMAGGARASHN